jgi:PqqD family protein of HPr-rel-A system
MTDTAGTADTAEAGRTTGSTIPRPHHSVETAFLPPEAVLFDDRHGEIHHLNPSASAVWVLLDGELSIDEVTAELSDIFSVPGDQMRGDVIAAVEDFRTRGLLDGAHVRPDDRADDDPADDGADLRRADPVAAPIDADPHRLEVVPRPPDT